MAVALPTFTPTWHNTSYDAIDPSKNKDLSAAGKTILITGGARGIGARMAESFAIAGAKNIILVGRTIPHLEEHKELMDNKFPKTKVLIFSADVADDKAVETVFDKVAARVGSIDVLVSNAGYLPKPAPVLESSLQDWWQGFQTNILGGINLVRSFLKHASDNPTMINITTGITHIPAIPGFSSYSASKGGFLRALDFVAVENPALKIFHLHPGVVATEMHAKSGVDMPVDDISLPANFTVWLTSPEAEFLRGRYIWVNWDVQELMDAKESIIKEDKLVMGLRGWPAA